MQTSVQTTATTTTDQAAVEIETTTERFVTRLASGEYEAAVEPLSPFLQTSLDEEFVLSPFEFPSTARAAQRLWTGLTYQHGEFQSLTEIETETASDGGVGMARLECEQDSQRLEIEVNGEQEITGIRFPPGEYRPPSYAALDAFEEREVSIQADGPELDGILTVPTNVSGSVPAVVLVAGEAFPDRDYTVGVTKIFKDIAWGLASRGIASYRYDSRLFAADIPNAETDIDVVLVNDAVAALERVAEADGVNDDQLYVAGGNLASFVTPRIADQYGNCAGVKKMGAITLPWPEHFSRDIQNVREAEWPTRREQELLVERYKRVRAAAQNPTEIDPSATVKGSPGGLWKSLFQYDHVAATKNLDMPVFISSIGRAITPSQENLAGYRGSLSGENNRIQYNADLNRHLQRGVDGYVIPEGYVFQDNVAEYFIEDFASWIESVSG